MVFLSHGYRGAPLPVAHLASSDLVSLHSLSYLQVSGRRRRYFWRPRLPPQSFLPMGIGEATPLLLEISSPSTVFPSCGYRGGGAVTSGDLVSLHSLSFLWVSGRRRRYFWRSRLPPQSFLSVGIGEATLPMPHIGDASSVLHWRRLQRLGDAWCDQPVDLTLASTLVGAWA